MGRGYRQKTSVHGGTIRVATPLILFESSNATKESSMSLKYTEEFKFEFIIVTKVADAEYSDGL